MAVLIFIKENIDNKYFRFNIMRNILVKFCDIFFSDEAKRRNTKIREEFLRPMWSSSPISLLLVARIPALGF
jgi:Fe-S-cluster formation regulator IscX/YfhJ